MAAIFVYILRGTAVEMPGQACELQTCSEHIIIYSIVTLPRRIPLHTVYCLHKICQIDKGAERAAQWGRGCSAMRTAPTDHDWASCQV